MTRPRPRRSGLATALATLLVVGACGTTTPTPPSSVGPSVAPASVAPSVAPTAAPTAAPTPAPTPTPLDAVTPFLAAIGMPGFTARATVSGMLVVGTATSPIAGTYDVSGTDYHRALKIGAGTKVTTKHLIVSESAAYTATGDGPWFEAAFPAAGSGLASVLHSIQVVVDRGVETKNGRQLHHLVATGALLPPAVLGLTDPSITAVTGTLEFWVSDDGTPQVIGATGAWTQKSGKDPAAPATLTAELAVASGGAVAVTAPEMVWKRVKSTRYRYSMAYPTDWEYEKGSGTKWDYFQSPDVNYVGMHSLSNQGYSLNAIVSAFIRYEPRSSGISKFKVESNKAAKLADVRARRLEYREKYKGDTYYVIDVVSVHKGRVYDIEYVSLRKLTAEDRALFDQFLSTFQFT